MKKIAITVGSYISFGIGLAGTIILPAVLKGPLAAAGGTGSVGLLFIALIITERKGDTGESKELVRKRHRDRKSLHRSAA